MIFLLKKIFGYLHRLEKISHNVVKQKKLKELIKSENLVVGKQSYQWELLEIDVYKGSDAKIIIGNYCSVSKNVRIITGGIHPVNWVSTFPFRVKMNLPGKYEDGMPKTNGDIIIGNDVWIGTNVTILSGLRIGDGAVIMAGALVSKSVPPYAIVGGIPAKIIKYRFNEERILKLLKIRWWDWEEKKILKKIPLLSSENIDVFIDLEINEL